MQLLNGREKTHKAPKSTPPAIETNAGGNQKRPRKLSHSPKAGRLGAGARPFPEAPVLERLERLGVSAMRVVLLLGDLHSRAPNRAPSEACPPAHRHYLTALLSERMRTVQLPSAAPPPHFLTHVQERCDASPHSALCVFFFASGTSFASLCPRKGPPFAIFHPSSIPSSLPFVTIWMSFVNSLIVFNSNITLAGYRSSGQSTVYNQCTVGVMISSCTGTACFLER